MRDPGELDEERKRPLKRAEYDQLVESGAFRDERLELLHGTLVARSPQGARHAEVIRRLSRLLFRSVGDRAHVSVQAPFAASEVSEPEPDLALLPPADYSRGHPAAAYLIAEVAESSLTKDRRLKAELYAAAHVPEYWLLDLKERVIEVRSDPLDGRYRSLRTVLAGDTLSPQQFPDVVISVAELLA